MISWLGNLEESPSNPRKYDAYHNTADGCSYIYDVANWTLLASKGDKGDAGTNGRSIVWKGTFHTHPENPQELWTYYNATDGNAYIYSDGSWSLLIGNLSSPSITGTIVENGNLYAVSSVYIKVVDESSNNTVWNSLPAADGDFAVSGLDASRTYTLHFSSRRLSDVNITNSKGLTPTGEDVSFGAVRTNVSPLSGKAQDLGSIVLSPNGTVHGTVVLGGGSGTGEGVDVFLDGTPYATRTDSNGEYTIKDVLQGSYSMVFRKDGYITQSRDIVVFSSNPSEAPSLEVPSVKLVMGSCTLKGTVGYEDRTDMSGVNVVLMGSNGDVCRTSLTEKDGSFSFEGISPDAYTIRAGADGYTTVDRRISISMGESYVVPMGSLVNLCGSITGSVTTNDSGLKSGVKVKASSSNGGHSYETTTDGSGHYTLSNVLHGDYVLTFEKEGYEAYTTGITVEPGRNSTAGARLKSRFGSIRVIVSFVDRDDPTGIVVNVYRNGTLIFSSTTTSTGIIVIANLPIGDGYSVIASSDGYGSSGEDKVTVSSGTVSEDNLQKLSNRYGSIKGRVVDAGGNPIESATVGISSDDGNFYTLTTSNDGTFSKTDVVIGTYSISVSKVDYLVATLPVTYTIESSLVTEIKDNVVLVSKYAQIRGKASFIGKNDASNISVTIEDSEGRILGTIVTGATGEYSFKVESGTYRLRANSQGCFESYRVFTVVAGNSYDVDVNGLVLMYGSVSGKVQDQNGVTIEGATIRLVSVDESSIYTCTSTSDGSFSNKQVLVGDYSVYVGKTGFQTVALPLEYGIESSMDTSIGVVTLTSEYAEISGSVGYSDRTDSSGILVTIEDSSGRTIDSFTIGSDGTFSFRVSAGTFAIKANADGYAEASKSITVVVGKTYSIDLGRMNTIYGSIAGKVVDSAENAVSGAVVNMTNMKGGEPLTLSTNENGEFSSSTVPIGTYTVSITKSGYIDAVCNDVPIVGGRTYDVGTKTLVSGTAGITGRVVLEGASNYSGVTVSATSLADSSKLYTTTTTEDGLYYFVSLDVGTWLLKFQKDGYLSIGPEQVPLASDKIEEVKVITLRSENSVVKGTVSLDGSSSFLGVNVLLKNSSDGTTFSTTTDIEGRYVISNVKPGSYELILSKEGYSSTTMKDLYVDKGTTKVIDEVSLDIAVTSIKGQVSLELRTDFSGALVTATSISNPNVIYSAITNSQGTFTFAKMYSGEYRIVVSCNGYSSITLPTVRVADDKPMDIGSVSLDIERGTIAGIARLEGYSNHSCVKVTILGTDYETTTSEDGSYSFSIPAGNYPGGLRFESEDFETTSYASTIPVLTNSTYAIPDMELKCLRTSIHGKVDVLTTDDESDVTVSFDGESSISPFVTTSTGEFLFEHVPLGDYVMRFKREDCSDITVPVNVAASDGIELSTITLTPNTATLTGKVTLKDALSSDGVRVSVDMGDGKVLETYTDISGRYELGGVSIADAYTVQYSKEGWNGTSQAMTSKLDALERRELPEVVMTDTTAPVLKSVVINNGSNTTADKNVVIHVNAEDLGSGCKTIIISDFNSSGNITYANAVDWTLEGVNGEKTVYVKVIDRAGNESNTLTASITLTDQKTEVKGVLKGDNLVWTKDRSPYLVTGNLLVEKDDVLKIEPGVDVQFESDYYLQVEGKLEAKGTEDERISFYGIGAGEDNWYGMRFINDNDSVISYSNIRGLKNGISGYCDIDHVEITANGWAIGISAYYDDEYCLSGNLMDSMVNGNVSVKNGFVASNEIRGTTIYLYSANVDGNTFEGTSLTTSYCFVYNNDVSTTNVASVQDIQRYLTYNDCNLQIEIVSVLSQIQFNNCTFSKLAASVNDSNFINCGVITITTDRKNQLEFDLTGNYWGELNTIELDSKGDASNMSFINDYYDDFNLTKVLYSNWKGSSVSDAGYQGEDFGRDELTTTVYSIGDTGPAGGLIFYDKGFYSDGWRYLEAASSDIGNSVFGYYRPDKENNNPIGTSLAVGSGKYNTERLVKYMDMDGTAYSYSSGEDVKEYAARKCFDYSYGGYDDWFLPSKDELNLLSENLHKKGLGSFDGSYYWSSSEYDAGSAWAQNFSSGSQDLYYRYYGSRVRPIRAF